MIAVSEDDHVRDGRRFAAAVVLGREVSTVFEGLDDLVVEVRFAGSGEIDDDDVLSVVSVLDV